MGVTAKAWFKSIIHMLFLFDPRTERVIGEPDSGNKAILDLCQRGGMQFSSSEDIRFSVQEVFNYVESVR